MFANFINSFYKSFEKLPFDALVYAVFGTYIAVFVITLVLCFCSKKIKQTSKRPFLCFTNAYAALVCAVFLFERELGQSLVASVMFWVVGYVLYGLLCLLTKSADKTIKKPVAEAVMRQSVTTVAPRTEILQSGVTEAPKNSVRLEHAAAVTDKLLSKNLSKTDRLELEKLKNTLAVLQIKGSLTPAESEILNENFNALLKLMAKYNV